MWQVACAGLSQVSVLSTAWTSGTADIALYASPAPNNRLIGPRYDGSGTTWVSITSPGLVPYGISSLVPLSDKIGAFNLFISAPKNAKALIRKIRKTGLDSQKVEVFIELHAPAAHREDYSALWLNFLEDAYGVLVSDMDYALNDALSLLRRECNVK